jgi:hypothetical protein
MTCPKCKGIMAKEDLYVSSDQVIIPDVFRCINCGEIIDPVILENRKNCPSVRTSRKPKHGD